MPSRHHNLWLAALVAAGVVLAAAVVLDSLSPPRAATAAETVAPALQAAAPPPARPEVAFERISIEMVREKDLSLTEARYYERLADRRVRCVLCPNYCLLSDGERGLCKARLNNGGRLRSLVYGRIVSAAVDPIEKKPLFHVLPGADAFSIATAGCNIRCIFCQNWQISQMAPEDVPFHKATPESVVDAALARKAAAIAYTYNEPTVFYEFMLDTATLARKHGIRNAWITCGYINPEPLREFCKVLDAANVDLKGFSDDFYTRYAAGAVEPVLSTLKILKEEGVWFEITNLVIPDANDDPKQIRAMCRWIRENLGPEVPLHFSRFFPKYKMESKSPTPLATLEMAARIAREEGIQYVYVGNVRQPDSSNTYCPKCRRLLIERHIFAVLRNNLIDGRCPDCGQRIPGIWRD